jgi:pyruvate,water dikinase
MDKKLWYSHSFFKAPGWLGGKGKGLATALHLGLPIPAFVAVHPEYSFDSTELLDYIKNCFPKETLFAVRSSAGSEDGAYNSFAGILETELNVLTDAIPEALTRVRNSANSERAQTYLAHNQLEATPLTVLIMPMLRVKWSGIFFGKDPTGIHAKRQILSVHQGLGDALVSGEVDGHYIYLNRDENGIVQAESDVIDYITKEDLIIIQNWHEKLYLHLGQFQDLELAYADGRLFLLQARAVTTGHLNIDTSTKAVWWDNSNIVESYPGLVLPATFSFIKPLYTAVYLSLSRLLGIPENVISRYSSLYDQMLGLHKGQIYYNLNSWFGILSLLPGYNLNAAFMEQMMGVSERAPIEPLPGNTGWRARLDVANMAFCMLKAHFKLPNQAETFEHDFESELSKFYGIELIQLSLSELLDELLNFQNTLVVKWNAPLVNDLMAMIWFGMLGKKCKSLSPDDEGNQLLNSLMVHTGGIVTVGPAREMEGLVISIRNNPELLEICQQENSLKLWNILNTERKYTNVLEQINRYLNTWGLRCKAELKLETVPYALNPEGFMSLLIEQVRTLEIKTQDPSKINETDGSYFRNSNLISKWWRGYILNQARSTISRRERLRYKRTEGFHAVRLILLQMGRALQSSGLIESYRDIFYISLTELKHAIESASNTENWKSVIEQRKEEYKHWESEMLPERFVCYDTALMGRHIKTSTEITSNSEGKKEMQGKGCSPGIVRGEVQLLRSPEGVHTLNGKIMVAESTDPGWVVLFPTASAILVERGSLLSHAAIVCREMGIPCIVGLPGIMNSLKDGDQVELNGGTGKLIIL